MSDRVDGIEKLLLEANKDWRGLPEDDRSWWYRIEGLIRRAIVAGTELGRQTWRHEFVSASKGEEWLAEMLAKARAAGYAEGIIAGRREGFNAAAPIDTYQLGQAKAEGAREENEAICGILEDWGVARRSIELISARRKP